MTKENTNWGSLFSTQKIVVGILADKNRPMTPGQIASEYYSQLATNIVMNWKLCNVMNKIINWQLQSEDPTTCIEGIDLEPIPDKPLDSLSLNLTFNDYSAKLEFIRKATKWLVRKNSKGIILSLSAIAHNLLNLPLVKITEKRSDTKFYVIVIPPISKEWKAERTKLIDEINQNPFARFDEETLRLFDLSNYLLSLRLQEIRKLMYHKVDGNPHSFIEKLGLPKSFLSTSLLIQFYAVPLADKLDGAVFASHFVNE
jgi:hypothetical protein